MGLTDGIALGISIIALIFAILSWRTSKLTALHNVIEDIRKDYRSPEMHHAVKTLWEFFKDCRSKREDFVVRYFKILKDDNDRICKLNEDERIKAEKDTLHYQRRLVSHFYQYVSSLYVNKILPRNIIFKTWIEDDLRIIPDIIIPIEKKLPEIIKTPDYIPVDKKDFPLWLLPMHTLYEDSKKNQRVLFPRLLSPPRERTKVRG
jgi:hypothetical protein